MYIRPKKIIYASHVKKILAQVLGVDIILLQLEFNG
jgi:hypothetical protein